MASQRTDRDRSAQACLRAKRRDRARRQEGGVILIVLLMVTMMSGLAAFAAQNGTYEVRSVGGTRQLQRLRRSGESFVVAVGSFLGERFMGGKGTVSVADTRWTANLGTEQGDFRKQYNLPRYVDDPSLLQVSRNEFGGLNYPLGVATLPKDSDINPGVVYPFELDGVALLERYDMPTEAGQGMGLNSGMNSGQRSYRVCVTAYSRMRVQGDKQRVNETRQLHESLGISRAYFELR